MNKAAHNRFRDFLLQVNGIALSKRILPQYRAFPHGLRTDVAPFFDLQNDADAAISIAFDKRPDQTKCLLTVRYTRKIACVGPMLNAATPLPEPVISLIEEYAHHHIFLQFEVAFGDEYPFTPPTWSLAHADTAIDYDGDAHGGLTLPEYYAYLVELHNDSYRRATSRGAPWSPAITIEKDVLQFVTRIHHFDCLST